MLIFQTVTSPNPEEHEAFELAINMEKKWMPIFYSEPILILTV